MAMTLIYLILATIFIVSAWKFTQGIINIREYKTSKLVLHAFLATWSGTTIITWVVLDFIERL
ncbi:hypothetical protein JARJAR_6 [Bacillus phage vB_BanH_JarJar]|nr:hypothetical protein JARJAR_6 [Bacillus phage vB_BanH_JarJar]UGO50311.1 hypothetical protein RONSWANSON_5 [Bacillus phage vB_BanH_RonSwanson]